MKKRRCDLEGCKKKELMLFDCKDCVKAYCSKHRLNFMHECSGYEKCIEKEREKNKVRLLSSKDDNTKIIKI